MKPNLEKNLDELISREANLTFSIFHCPLSFEREGFWFVQRRRRREEEEEEEEVSSHG